MLKYITISFLFFTTSLTAQKLWLIRSGTNYIHYKEVNEIQHYVVRYDAKHPSYNISIEYYNRNFKAIPSPSFAIGYKSRSYSYFEETSGLSPVIHTHETENRIDMIELNICQKVFLNESSPFYAKAGAILSKTIYSYSKGISRSHGFKHTNNNYYSFSDTIVFDKKNNYQSEFALNIGTGIDWLFSDNLGLNISNEFFIFFQHKFPFSYRINAGVVWIFNEKKAL